LAQPGEPPKRRGRPTPGAAPAVGKTPRRPLRPPAKRMPELAPAAPRSQKLQKVLAQAGLGSRRAMEELISSGKVKVNGAQASLGQRVTTEDAIQVGRRQIKFQVTTRLPRVILYHKPEGEIVCRDDPRGRRNVFEKLPAIRSAKWLAVGRLDFNTCGLLLFTTSGELANRLMHPRFQVEREYAVRILGHLAEDHMQQLTRGVRLSDGEARFDLLEWKGGDRRNRWYRIVVKEGRNRIVRRMFEALGFTVSRLKRVRFGIISLPEPLKRGTWTELKESEIRKLLDWVGSDTSGKPAAPASRASAARSPDSSRRAGLRRADQPSE
jgi:23S rRNA pseudouridine2605 synthase